MGIIYFTDIMKMKIKIKMSSQKINEQILIFLNESDSTQFFEESENGECFTIAINSCV